MHYIKFLFIFFVSNFFHNTQCEEIDIANVVQNNTKQDAGATLHEAEAINEVKKQLYDIYNYVLMNNYVPQADKIPSTEINEIIEDILANTEVYNNIIPLVMLQIELKEQNNINNNNALINLNVDYYTAIGFYTSILAQILFTKEPNTDSTIKKILYSVITTTFAISTIGQLFTLIIKNKLGQKKDFLAKTNKMLQEKRMEMNTFLVNSLINALEEKVKLYI